MITVKCTYENGDTVTTRINATFSEAQDYFLNRVFNIGDGPNDNMQKCIAVEEIITLKGLTPKQQEIIRDNYAAYIHNFERPVIMPEDYGKGFYVYRNEQEAKEGNSWVQFCYNIDYLNGWLYGAVQAKCKQVREAK